jgi:hypothetical protein
MKNQMKLILASSLMIAASGCSHTSEGIREATGNVQYEKVDETPGINRKDVQLWRADPTAWAGDHKGDGYDIVKNEYHASEGKGSSDTDACENARDRLFDEMARTVGHSTDNKSSEATSRSAESASSDVSESSESASESSKLSASQTKSDLSGVSFKQEYWEQRDYSKQGGGRNIYYCWVLAEVPRQDLERAKNKYRNRNSTLKQKAAAKIEKMEKADDDGASAD